MDIEHQTPEATDSSGIDPSNKPENLVVQDGEDKGRINAFETEQGTAVQMTDMGIPGGNFIPVPIPDVPDSEQPYTVEGIPVIGAEAENEHREDIDGDPFTDYDFSIEDMETFKKRSKDPTDHLFGKVPEETTPKQMAEILHDLSGTEAMAEAVKTKAIEYAKKNFPRLDEADFEKFGQKMADKFKEELEKKSAEEKAKQKKGLEDLMSSLDSPDTSASDVVPGILEPESEAAKQFKTLGIHVETPQGHSGFSHIEGTEIPS